MKRVRILVLAFLSASCLKAQQRPHYTQYVLNNYVLNPAISGIENYTDLKLSARDQWVGLNGAPRTLYLTVHGPLGKKDYKTTATSFSVPGQNPRGSAYWENYTASESHHGIGLNLVNDRTGSFNRFSAAATYAYHLGLTPTLNLSAGFSAGITVVGIDRSKHDFTGGGDPNDPVFGSLDGEINKLRPDLGAGLWLYSGSYFIGLSAQQIIPQKIQFVDDAAIKSTGELVPHIFFTGGYRFLISEDLNAIPSLMFKYVNASSENNFQVEINSKLQYRDLLWIGGSYRHEDGYAAMLGLNVGNTFNVGYAYDFTRTNLNTVSRGTHELVIGFLLGNKWGDTCPRNVW